MHSPPHASNAGGLAAAQPAATILAVLSSADEQDHLRAILAGSGWTLRCVSSNREARASLGWSPTVILVSDELPGGSWRDLQRDAAQTGQAPAVIVVSRLADERLWLEVLDSGAFDLLAKPLRRDEVLAVLDAARRASSRARRSELRPAMRAAAAGTARAV